MLAVKGLFVIKDLIGTLAARGNRRISTAVLLNPSLDNRYFLGDLAVGHLVVLSALRSLFTVLALDLYDLGLLLLNLGERRGRGDNLEQLPAQYAGQGKCRDLAVGSRLGLLGSRICCGRLGFLLRLALRIALGIALTFRRRRLLLRMLGLALLCRLAFRLLRSNPGFRILVLRRSLLGCSLGMGAAAPAMTASTGFARGALPRLLARRLLALDLGINHRLRLNRLLLAGRRLSGFLIFFGLFGLNGRSWLVLLLALYGICAPGKTAPGTARTRGLLGRLLNIVCNLGMPFGLMLDVLLRSLKVSAATTFGLLRLNMLLSTSRFLHFDGLFLGGLSIRLILLSNGATEALLLGAALRIALAASAKAASACLGSEGTHDMLVK